MTTRPQSHGVQLTLFLQNEWDALGTTRGAWCRSIGLAASTVLRWSQGVEPDLRNLQIVADGLDRRLIDVLHGAGYIDSTDIRTRSVASPRERMTIDVAIKTDQMLSDPEREALLAVHKAFQAVTRQTPQPRRTKRVPAK